MTTERTLIVNDAVREVAQLLEDGEVLPKNKVVEIYQKYGLSAHTASDLFNIVDGINPRIKDVTGLKAEKIEFKYKTQRGIRISVALVKTLSPQD